MQYALDFIDNVAGMLAFIAAGYTAYMQGRMKNMILESEERMLAKINGTYIRRTEVVLMKEQAERDHGRIESDIQRLEDRINEGE